MNIQDILSITDIGERINKLSVNGLTDDFVKQCREELDPKKHSVYSEVKRPKKERKVTRTINGEKETTVEYKEVNRIAVPLQQTIIERAVAFLFGIPVMVSANGDTANREAIGNAFKLIGEDNKIDSVNRQVARVLFSCTQVAEYWYKTDDEAEDRYGFVSKAKLRCQVFSPLNGDKLYPFFDERGDLIAFSRGFVVTDGDEDVEYFETWIGKTHERYRKGDQGWVLVGKKEDTGINKLPIVYAKQPYVEHYFVQSIIERFETVLSNNGDINDRHATPILAAWGEVKTDIGDFVQLIEKQGQRSDIKYVERPGNAEAVNKEMELLEQLALKYSQTPDISMDSMIGNLATETLTIAFIDAHMKVQNKMEVFDSYLTRRYNIIKSFLSVMTPPSWKSDFAATKVGIKVTPYMIGNDATTISTLISAYDSGITSLERVLELNPHVENVKEELERLMKAKDEAIKRQREAFADKGDSDGKLERVA